MTITFVTDQSGDHTGWKVHYTSTGESKWDPGGKLRAPVSSSSHGEPNSSRPGLGNAGEEKVVVDPLSITGWVWK